MFKTMAMVPLNLEALGDWIISCNTWFSRWLDASFAWLRDIREANERAEALLRACLSETERTAFRTQGYLELPSRCRADRRYRVPAHGGRVRVYERGRFCGELCVGPVNPLPAADVVLTHKLMIEGNEEEYLRFARWIQPLIPSLIFIDSQAPESLQRCDNADGRR